MTDPRTDRRAEELLPEEEAAGSADPQAQASEILAESDARTVRRGRRPSAFIRRTASHATTTPPASSIAPCPTSHESMCPPITTTSSGFSRPRSSATTLRDGASGSVRALIWSRTLIG